MTAVLHPHPRATLAPYAPIAATLFAMRSRHTESATNGLHPGLLVADPNGWTPATQIVNGSLVPSVLQAAERRWHAHPPAAAALAWKSYTFWLALPAVLAYAAGQRVPHLDPEQVLVRFHDHQPFLTIGLRADTLTSVLPSDPIATAQLPGVRVERSERDLLRTFRETLLDRHLAPLQEHLHSAVHLGARTLRGSIASGVAYGVARAAHAIPGSGLEIAATLLDALGVAELVDLSETETGELVVRRRTCCLAFTLPTPKICSGCVLR